MIDFKVIIRHAALLLCLTAQAQETLPPAFGCYRSFVKQPEMGKIFSQELGLKTRCFFASNTINRLGGGYCEYPPIWTGEGEYAFEHLDEQMEEMKATFPDGNLICMVDLNTPWWLSRKLFRFDSFTDIVSACCSPRWKKMTMQWMKDFLSYAESRYGDRIAAYILCAGSTTEWLDHRHGYPTMEKEMLWPKWCKERGVDHGPSGPTFADLHTAAFENRLYDPATEQAKVDWWVFSNDVVAEALLDFAHEARTMLPEGKQIGAFFGYFWGSGNTVIADGHMEYERVYASPDLDFFISPGSYTNRMIGGGSGSQTMFGTAMLNGKRFLHEIDFRPHDFGQKMKGKMSNVKAWNSAEEDIVGNTREACFALINHASYWWFDMWGGFYDDPRLRERIGEMEKIQERFREDLSPSVAEILFIGDPQSIYYLREQDPLCNAGGEGLRNRLSVSGAPIDCYSFNDMERLDLSRYKVIMLPQVFLIDGARARFLQEKVCKDGRTVLFSYAPGIIDGKTLDPERVSAWAGVPFVSGATGFSETPMGEWTSVYAYDPNVFTTEVLRGICERAGVHFYTEDCNPVFANGRLLSIHCKEGGLKTVSLPRKAAKVVDLLSGEVGAKRTKSFRTECASPDTRLFEIIWK